MKQPFSSRTICNREWWLVLLFLCCFGVSSAHDLESIPTSPISSGVPIAGHFSLLSSDNKLINEKSYENKYKLIFLGIQVAVMFVIR